MMDKAHLLEIVNVLMIEAPIKANQGFATL
jgi:hypothetical protein